MSGDGKRGVGQWPQATAPILDSTHSGHVWLGIVAVQMTPISAVAYSCFYFKGIACQTWSDSEPGSDNAATRFYRGHWQRRCGVPTCHTGSERAQRSTYRRTLTGIDSHPPLASIRGLFADAARCRMD